MGRTKTGTIYMPSCKIKAETMPKLRKTAISLGFRYADGAAVGAFLDAIANADIDLLSAAIAKSNVVSPEDYTYI
jgi:hypothetical protein